MTEPAQEAAGTGGFTMLGGDDALTCTDQVCLMPSVPGAVTVEPAAQ